MRQNPSGSFDTELLSEVLRIQTKVFYIDLKENSRGQYLKIAEKGKHRPKSSVVVSVSGLQQLTRFFHYYLEEAAAGRTGEPCVMIVETKVFNFSVGDNERGRFLRIFESGGGYPAGGSSLMIPVGWGCSNLRIFKECIDKVALFVSQGPNQAGISGFGMGMPIAAPPSPGGDPVVLDTSRAGTPVLSVDSKHFFFDVKSNDRGRYLKIKEVSGNMKNLLVIPVVAIPKFLEAIGLAVTSSGR